MKKIVLFLILILGFFLFALSSLLAQKNSFDDCFEVERLKAESEGANAEESINQAKEICNLKFNQEDNDATENSAEENLEVLISSDSIETPESFAERTLEVSSSKRPPIFAIDIFIGKKKVKGERDEKLVTTGVLLNYYITPKFSFAAGYLLSKGDINRTVVNNETESYIDYSDYYYVDETYDATVARYTDETYDTGKIYYLDETYDATVATRYVDETYDTGEIYYLDETYDATVTLDVEETSDTGKIYYLDETYDATVARYTDETYDVEEIIRPSEISKPGLDFRCVFFESNDDNCYDWDGATVVIGSDIFVAGEACKMIGSYIGAIRIGDTYHCAKEVAEPKGYNSSCYQQLLFVGAMRCIKWEYEETIEIVVKFVLSHYETETLTRQIPHNSIETTIVSYYYTKTFIRQIPHNLIETIQVLYYDTETRQVTRNLIDTSQVFSHYETGTLTRQVASYVTKTRQVSRSRTENLSIKNIESSLGVKWHLLGNGLVDFFLGAGIVNISHSREYLNTVESGSGSGTYFETGIKYIFNSGFNIGYYWRRSSATFELTNNANQQTTETDGGGITSGLTFGFAF